MNSKITLKDCQTLAKTKLGKCLSSHYKTMNTKMSWECKVGHQWETTFASLYYRNTWCPFCSGRIVTLEKYIKIAEARGGKCLSDAYIKSNIKLEWECDKGHKFSATPNDIQQGSWCPICAGNIVRNIEDCKKLAKNNEGKCLSTIYKNVDTKMLWECKFGHQWETTYYSVKTGHWCLECSGKKKHTIEFCQKIAKERNGECLSEAYVGVFENLTWKCEKDHVWEATLDNINNGKKWCPKCKNKTEQKCREIFENLFNRKFNSIRPSWLINPKTGFRLELDGYCEELRLAFEYDGEQHFYDIKHYKRSSKTQQEIDEIKNRICKENNITLIRIPYWEKDEMSEYIIKELLQQEVEFERS